MRINLVHLLYQNMKKNQLLGLFCCLSLWALAQNKPSIHTYSAKTIDGYTIPFTQFYGKKIMFVNTASFCGYTSQYGALEQLYQNYKQHNFIILGFPCNDFGGQEPFNDSTIKSFFLKNYGISFPMMSKISIASGDTSKVYKWLQRGHLNGVANNKVDWNFNKFLVNESGNLVAHHSSLVSPLDSSIIKWILSPSSITSVGLNSSKRELDFAELISPNPTSSRIDLVLKKTQYSAIHVRLYSLDGKLINGSEQQILSEKISYDISNLAEGVYVLRIDDGNIQQNIKIVVAR